MTLIADLCSDDNVSPVLVLSLLHKMRSWTNTSLGMYIDDGTIFACGDNWEKFESSI